MGRHLICRRTALAALAVAISFAFSLPSAYAQSTLGKIKAQGYIRTGFANEPPFAYATPEGTLAGIDVEILQQILSKMGVKDIDPGLTTFGGLIPGLKAKRFDLIIGAIYIKADRCKQVAFVEPLYILGDTVIVPKGNPKNIHSYSDVAAKPEFKLGYIVGGTAISDNAKVMGVRDDQLVGFPDNPSGFAAVKAGRIDGYASAVIVATAQLRKLNDPGLERASPFAQPIVNGVPRYGIAGIAVRLEDKDLLTQINKYLLELRSTPKYVAIFSKYGLSSADLPPQGTTTKKTCAR